MKSIHHRSHFTGKQQDRLKLLFMHNEELCEIGLENINLLDLCDFRIRM